MMQRFSDNGLNATRVEPFAKFKGHTFPVWEIKDDEVLLAEGSYRIAHEVGFPPSDLEWERGLYKKWIKKSEVEKLREVKRSI
jgi:hypothetical protein